ncbi:putative glucan endo-1,3-alpha-glucosidase agn1 [Amylocarpus encephaloides]|uniref:Glucan endo-1,3-alpha-glucosidase agn1 n=1 Tax=Amylocarpus encephaloides TaxID=45428 RepID=A0A9P7YSV5_9HELO|nr:putative glucan endo-1,3-alpha-glucosidase agn1 [Amylocarpus encephaloides]
MGNTAAHTLEAWTKDLELAQAAGIDAFVLNMGFADPNISPQVVNAFNAAEALGSSFKLLFAFDYRGGGQPWPSGPCGGGFTQCVIGMINKYQGSAAYFKYKNLPFVSTFEGGTAIDDYAPNGIIRGATGGIYFVPNYDGSGLKVVQNSQANIDGIFSWSMWPEGANNKTTSEDFYWKDGLKGKSYMMGVSPWFFHSGEGALEPWVWRGDSLWADRWAQTLEVNPEFVQIVTSNDYGEAHYIGPPPLATSEVPQNSQQYVDGHAHDSWRNFLPYYIASYKGESFTISKDQLQYWYRTTPKAGSGNTCNVKGNSPSAGQSVVDVNTIVEDGVFLSALLMDDSDVRVQIGGGSVTTFQGKKGINHWSVPFNGQTGAPVFKVVRSGVTGTGAVIKAKTTLASGCTNYNAWVGSA